MVRRAALTFLVLLSAFPVFAQRAKDPGDLLDTLVVPGDTAIVGTDILEASAHAASLPPAKDAAYRRFLSEYGGSWKMYYDRVTGNVAVVEGSGIPWIAGSGNQLPNVVDGRLEPGEAAPHVDRVEMEARARNFIDAHPDLFGVIPGELELMANSGPVLDYLYFLHFQWTYQRIPVEQAYVVFRLNHGNLVQFGSERVSDAIRTLDPTPRLDPEAAWSILRTYVGSDGRDVPAGKARLLVMPVAARATIAGQEPAAPIAYRLVHVLTFRRAGVMGTWEARIDAHSGEIVSFRDVNAYGQIQGGTYTTDKNPTQTEINLPFPFANYGSGQYADGAGLFPGTTGTSTLNGRYVRLVDTCGAISLAADAAGVINFGGSTGTNCTTPGFGGAGNTHATRTQYWNLDAIKTKGRSYLPANAWLGNQLTANVNLNQTCNAYWNGSTVNFFRSGGGCGNTGELPGVSLHEWGHGMDQNDGNGTADGGTGEAYGDISAFLQTHQSCIGGGFLGGNCSGYGNPCTSCTGVRDADYQKHSNPTPATPLGFNQSCPGSGGCSGPCGRECHCEAAPSEQAVWDLATRDLVTWGLDANSAWTLVDKLWYASRSTSTSHFSCTNNGSCSAGHLVRVFRVVDDCDGNLANGTPHASAIFAAFGRHQIGCNSDNNTDNNCACATLGAATLSGTPGNNQNSLTWTAVAGATSYDVFRNQVDCNSGFTLIANVATTSYTDTLAVNGYTYYYRVQARSTSSCPSGPMSNCVTLTPASGPNAQYVTASAVQTADTGDDDGYPDNCENVTVSFQVRNTGAGNLTNVRVTSITSSDPQVTVTSSFPILLGNLNTGQTATGSFNYSLAGATCAQSLDFSIVVTANEMGGNSSTGTFSFTAEQDLTVVPSIVYSFETDTQGWTVVTGTFVRTNSYGGSQGTFALRSSQNQDNQCDAVRSPAFQPTATSTLTVGTHFDIEPFSSGQWWDRANVAAYNPATTTRTVMSPTSGRLYNASGTGGTCSQDTDLGWAGTAASWSDSAGFNLAAFAGTQIQLEVRYGTDEAVAGTGFRIDNVRITNVMAVGCDTQSDTCGGCPTITVNPATLPSGTQGVAYSQNITASGGTGPYTFAVTSGSLPPGLTLSTAGLLSGTPTAPGSSSFTITATDSNSCTGNRAYTLVINCPTITLSPSTLPNGTQGVAYAQSITASGGTAPYAFTVSTGTLPPGLTLSTAGLLSGTPTLPGSYSFTVLATDANSCTGSQAYTVDIGCPTITLSPSTLPSGTQGTPYSQTITASGGTAPYVFTVSAGTLPPGLTLSAGGLLSGTPTAAGSYSFTVLATDANSCTGSQAYALDINPPGCSTITLTPATLPSGTEGVAYSQTIGATGGVPPYTFAVTAGALPPGLTLSSAGLLSGTPTTPGTFTFTVTATDANSCTGSQSYDLLITPAGCPTIVLTPLSLPGGTEGVPYAQTITANGGTSPYAFAITAGTLPPGITLSTAGVLSGTPTVPGSYPITVTATDANSCTGSRDYTLAIAPAGGCPTITISPATLPGGTEGIAYSVVLSASGGTAPYTYAVTAGALPAGLSLDSATGALSGSPTAAGTASFTVTATDSQGCTGLVESRPERAMLQAFSIDIAPAVSYLVAEGLGASNGNLVRVYSRGGAASSVQFPAYGAGQWGTNVAAGDINGAIYGEILTGPGPGPSYGPQVKAFDRLGTFLSKVNFYAYGTLKYGVNVAASDADGDGFHEIVSGAGPGDVFGPHVRGWNFDASTVTAIAKINYFAYGTLKYGVNVEDGDVDGDGFGEMLTGPGPGLIFGSQVRGFNYDGIGTTAIAKINFNAFSFSGFGVNVAGGNLDGDGFAELAAAPGPGPSHAALFRGFDYNGTGIVPLPAIDDVLFTSTYGGRVGLADLRADGAGELLAGPGRSPSAQATVHGYEYDGNGLTLLPGSPFNPFPQDFYGVNVSGGGLGHF